MEVDDALSIADVPSLEDLSIRSWMMFANRCLVGFRQESVVQDTLAGVLRESLGGVSSINTRSKMMERLVDVRFIIPLSKEHSPLSSAVNKVTKNSISSCLYLYCRYSPGSSLWSYLLTYQNWIWVVRQSPVTYKMLRMNSWMKTMPT